MDHDSYLHRRNPVIKLILILAITILVSLSYFPVLPFVTFIVSILVIWIGGKIPFCNLCKRMLAFIIVSASFVLSMLVLRGLDDEVNVLYTVWIFQWSKQDIIHALSLGLRILALVTMSLGFVLTTRPRDLVLSLILQCKVPVLHGYAALAAYRFLPELQEQVESIQLAQEIRGIPWNKNTRARLTSPFRALMPLLCVAARRGERVALAMESRGLGRTNRRTFYTTTRIDQQDIVFLLVAILSYGMLIAILIKLDLFQFSFAFVH